MDTSYLAIFVMEAYQLGGIAFFIALFVLAVLVVALFLFWWYQVRAPIALMRDAGNPVLKPIQEHWWESEAVFNPAAIVLGGRVHLLYRALGRDGVSRIGYASSKDGLHFDQRLPSPIYAAESVAEARGHYPNTSPARLTYDTTSYTSGGGWGGSEDPRIVSIDGRMYMTFNMFNGWDSMRVAFTTIDEYNLLHAHGLWSRFEYLSRPGERQKNWILFPEKINGKFALFHNVDKGDPSRVHIAFMDSLDMAHAPTTEEAPDPQKLPDHYVAWHFRTRSAAAPPIKTPYGWLLFYHATDPHEPHIGYKLGAMLLDLKDPTRVLRRSPRPVLEPKEWYENDWKPGVVYACGAVVLKNNLLVYYGGGDKYVAVARADIRDFVHRLISNEPVMLKPVRK